MGYKVISYFEDLLDEGYPYDVGDSFPREGFKVTMERIKELSGSDNKQKKPLIEEVTEDVPKKRTRKAK